MVTGKTFLILGGTGEARELARRAHQAFGDRARVVSSLAGRTSGPAAIAGTVRTGGFGGSEGHAHEGPQRARALRASSRSSKGNFSRPMIW